MMRVTYRGGYADPAAEPGPEGQEPLPDSLVWAAIEQTAWWYTNRDRAGFTISTAETGHPYTVLPGNFTLLNEVKAVLRMHRRIVLN